MIGHIDDFKNQFLIFGIIFLLQINISGQQTNNYDPVNLPNIVPPSPTAYALGNYGNVPVGLFTGSPTITVPLMTFKTSNITLPISLFYSSNGIRVDEVSSNVGSGWNLNFGGVITRMVRGLADENHYDDFVPDNVNNVMTNTVALNFFQNAGNSDRYDTQTDVYSFNFNEISGKFFYDRNHQVHLIDQQGIKVEKTVDSKLEQKFLVTISNGDQYYFEQEEKTRYSTVGSAGHQMSTTSGTAWYLSKIVSPKGDEISLTYENSGLEEHVSSESQTLQMTYPFAQFPFVGGYLYSMPPRVNYPPQQNMMKVMGVRIKNIKSNDPNDGAIDFIYSTNSNNLDVPGNFKIKMISQTDRNDHILEEVNFDYLNTQNNRNFLKGIIFKDIDKSYAFEYFNPDQFPERLSFSQDYWGYYNGKVNANLVPKDIPQEDYGLSNYNYAGADKNPDENFAKFGMLKQITYPTKGYTELEYEGNTYWGEKKEFAPYTIVDMHLQNPRSYGPLPDKTIEFTSPIDQKIIISGSSQYVDPENNSFHPTSVIQLLTNNASFYTWNDYSGPKPVEDEGDGVRQYRFISPDEEFVYFDAKAGHTYKLKLIVGRNTFNNCEIKFFASPPNEIHTNLKTGGLRVKSSKNYDLPISQPLYKRYYYAKKDDLQRSSGDRGYNPIYLENMIQNVTRGELQGTVDLLVLSSSSVMPMYDQSSSCFYKNVTISIGGDQFEKGGEEREFIINRDYPGSIVWGADFKNAPWTNFGWSNGLEFKTQIFSKNPDSPSFNIIKETINNYEQVENSKYQLNNYAFKLRYVLPIQKSVTKVCTQADVERIYHHYKCTTNHGHWWGSDGKCKWPNANNIDSPQYDLCYQQAVDTPVFYWQALNNIDVIEYKNISYWHYLKSQSNTDFLNGAPLKTSTEYFYNNPLHYQLTSQKTIFPDQSYQIADYKYAHEKGKTLMIEKNMVGIPLETSTTKGSKVLSRTLTDYPDVLPDVQTGNLLLPKSSSSLDLLTGGMSTEVTYKQYDSKGNLQQYTTRSGVTTAIVWGYNNTQPIAKIEGATYSQVSAYITNIIDQSNADSTNGTPASEKDVVDALDLFRQKSELSGFQITTYSYDPLIGVKSITPPNGVRQVYIYDTANRLTEVREQSQTGNLLKEYQYKYKN